MIVSLDCRFDGPPPRAVSKAQLDAMLGTSPEDSSVPLSLLTAARVAPARPPPPATHAQTHTRTAGQPPSQAAGTGDRHGTLGKPKAPVKMSAIASPLSGKFDVQAGAGVSSWD